MWLGIGLRLGARVLSAGAAPVVTSVSPDIGSPSGGGSLRTITGSGFTGATGVTFGGTAATSVTVVNDTTITCTVPAKTAGVVDVAVTTSSGTGTGVGIYEYWDPTVETCLQLLLKGNYATTGGPPATAATWTATVGTNVTHTATPIPVAVSGAPDFEASTDFPLGAAIDANTVWAGSGDHTFFCVINLESIVRNNATVYNNDGLIVDQGLYIGLYLRNNAGTHTLYFYEYDTGVRTASVNITSLLSAGGAGYLIAQGKKTGGSLYARAIGTSGAGTWTVGDACGSLASGASNLRIGSASAAPDGVMYVAGTSSTAWSDSVSAKFEKWARAEYP